MLRTTTYYSDDILTNGIHREPLPSADSWGLSGFTNLRTCNSWFMRSSSLKRYTTVAVIKVLHTNIQIIKQTRFISKHPSQCIYKVSNWYFNHDAPLVMVRILKWLNVRRSHIFNSRQLIKVFIWGYFDGIVNVHNETQVPM